MSIPPEKKIRFEGEENDEKVLMLLRAHIITNLSWILFSLFLLALPLFIITILAYLGVSLKEINHINILIAYSVWVLVTIGFAFQQLLHWYFNIYLLTNKRLIDIDFFGLFYRRISQTPLGNIQDVTFSKGGIFQNFFDYGDLHIQTAGSAANFEFLHIPDPEGNQQQILELVSEFGDGKL